MIPTPATLSPPAPPVVAAAAATDVYDMDAARSERARVRSERRAGRKDTQTIRFGGEEIATIEAEFPLDVLEPFADVNVDLALLIRNAIDMAAADSARAQLGAADMIVSVLAANPNLPHEVLAAVKAAAQRLLGEEGYTKLIAGRPTLWDIGGLVRNLMDWYGVGLGESLSSFTPSGDGGTSKPTSNASASTPAVTGSPPTIPTSEALVTSPLG